jgi:hypothetical protein
VSSASKWPKLTHVPVTPGSGWAQEDGDADPEPENYNYDDDDDEEEEEETNMIPGSRDRGTPAEGPASCSAQSIPPTLTSHPWVWGVGGAQHAHTLVLSTGCNLLHPELTPRVSPSQAHPTPNVP